jgi:hypothetical protein
MGSFPWGPHGPETSPNQVKPNPTPSDPVLPFGRGDSDAAQPTPRYAGAAANPFLSITLSILMVPLVWTFWICLYPVTAAASVFTGFVTASLLSRVLTAPDEVSVALLGGVIAGFVAAAIASRVEYKLTQNFALRWTRHVVRLILFGVLAVPLIQATNAEGSYTRYLLTVLSQPRMILSQLANPQNLGIALAVMVAMHFILWKADWLRAFWHRRLFWLGLK